MKDGQILGTARVRCPRCGGTEIEYDDESVGPDSSVRCPRCDFTFKAEDGADRGDIERAKEKALGLVEKELKRAFKPK